MPKRSAVARASGLTWAMSTSLALAAVDPGPMPPALRARFKTSPTSPAGTAAPGAAGGTSGAIAVPIGAPAGPGAAGGASGIAAAAGAAAGASGAIAAGAAGGASKVGSTRGAGAGAGALRALRVAAVTPRGVRPPATDAAICPAVPAPISWATWPAAPPAAPLTACRPGWVANMRPTSRVTGAAWPAADWIARPAATVPPAMLAPAAVAWTIFSAWLLACGTPTRVSRSAIASVGIVYCVPNRLLMVLTMGSPTTWAKVAAPAPAIAPGTAPTPANGAPINAPAAAPAAGNARPRVAAPARPDKVVSGAG